MLVLAMASPFTAQEYGFEPMVWFKEESVKTVQSLGIQAHCDLVQNIEFENQFCCKYVGCA